MEKGIIIGIDLDFSQSPHLQFLRSNGFHFIEVAKVRQAMVAIENNDAAKAILVSPDLIKNEQTEQINQLIQLVNSRQIPVIEVVDYQHDKDYQLFIGASDYFQVADPSVNLVKLIEDFNYLPGQLNLDRVSKFGDSFQMPIWKRLFDLAGAFFLILLLSPLMLIITAAIFFDSYGPIFYKSKRIGTGYQVFDFYKFRSMKVNADQLMNELNLTNQYQEVAATDSPVLPDGGQDLIGDEGKIDEQQYLTSKYFDEKNSFIKIQNDPRITRVGKFLRNTSLDELPQLFNVLKGDMSLVGNRPLPLYEAEKLTTDESIQRFMAPAGITGLWQVTERGKEGVNADSRKQLDIQYAKDFSLIQDLKILWKTIPASIQRENV
ncbi:MAG: sugar transferase [Candidatus Cyclobacteriaceae bacterium M3_2C_046]